ncbi:hypothetical protein VTJ04DRAFT_232 [Mycothermus thermophilus]|uniref:uncharacterized protein n=1 Tax=Humicola insolens TaxID=85995 RepID=UPI0037446DED
MATAWDAVMRRKRVDEKKKLRILTPITPELCAALPVAELELLRDMLKAALRRQELRREEQLEQMRYEKLKRKYEEEEAEEAVEAEDEDDDGLVDVSEEED